MNIFYNDNTLYINMDDIADSKDILKLKRRVFKILDDYSIDNIVLNIVTDNRDSKELLNSFIDEYQRVYHGKIIMKK